MTGGVIEIRLAAPRPYVLQMLAQPQMAILSREGGTGPYRRAKRGGVPGKALVLTPVERATNESVDELPVPAWQIRIVRAERAWPALTRFTQGKAPRCDGGGFF